MVYTLHSIVMVLLYYIYLLGTYHWLLSLILSVHFRNWMHLNINRVKICIWILATTQKLRKSPAFQFLVLAVNHFVLMAILNTCNISIKYIQWYVYLVCYIHCIYSRWILWPRFLHPYRIVCFPGGFPIFLRLQQQQTFFFFCCNFNFLKIFTVSFLYSLD